MKIIIILLFISLTGCSSDSEPDVADPKFKSTPIWNGESQRIIITQDNGYVPPGEERYTEYDYSLDTLSQNALGKIKAINMTETNLHCANDGVTFKIEITDSSGMIDIYVSNNRKCGRDDEIIFVSTDSITEIVESL